MNFNDNNIERYTCPECRGIYFEDATVYVIEKHISNDIASIRNIKNSRIKCAHCGKIIEISKESFFKI